MVDPQSTAQGEPAGLPMPTFNLVNMFNLRGKLYDQLAPDWLGTTLGGPNIYELTRQLQRLLPAGVSRDALYNSLSVYAGQPITDPFLKELVWRLAGNVSALKEGKPVRSWTVATEPEWIPLLLTRYDPSRSRQNEYQHHYRATALAGSLCPLVVQLYWSRKFVAVLSQRFGFSRMSGKYPYSDPRQLVNLWVAALLDPARCYRNEPGFSQIGCPPSFVTHNRQILKLRCRNGIACPYGYKHQCHRCAIGYEECYGATHKVTYEQGICTQCGQNNFKDVEVADDLCVTCYEKWLTRKRDV